MSIKPIIGKTDLASVNPDLAIEWNYEKKGNLKPTDVTCGSNKKVWWKCKYGHEWAAVINSRHGGHSCPYCSGKKAIKGETDLATIRPDLSEEWNYDKNEDLRPYDVTCGSSKKVWWKCKYGHEWEVTIKSRNNGNGCPYCSDRRVIKGETDLETERPDIAVEWNYQKNGDLKPCDVTCGSSKKVWWKCIECGYEYQTVIANRTKRNICCPICSKNKAKIKLHDYYMKKNGSLEDKYPDIAKEWHPTKNNPLKPSDVTASTSKKVWWLGECGHEWEAAISHRTPHNNVKGTGCPYCSNLKILSGFNDLQTKMPDLAKEWNYEKNDNLKPSDVTCGSNKNVWWKCKYGHEWKSTIGNRVKGNGCPKCSSQGTSLPEQGIAFYLEKVCKVEQRVKIDKQEIDVFLTEHNIGIEYDGKAFHPIEHKSKEKEKDQKLKNHGIKLIRIKESDYNSIDSNIIFFKVDYLGKNYEWAINQLCIQLVSLTGNKKFNSIKIDAQRDLLQIRERVNLYLKENSFSALNPDLAKEWHPNKNGSLTPEMFSGKANTKVWWKCFKGHEWQATINSRSSGNGCPFCSGTRAANKIVWWRCSECGNEFQANIGNRTVLGRGCPICGLKKQSISQNKNRLIKKGSLAENNPDIAKEWHPTKNGALKPTDVSVACNKRVWWKCIVCGNEWQTSINNRTSKGTGCPICARKNRKPVHRKPTNHKPLSLTHPELTKEWNYEKNGDLKPTDVYNRSSTKVWWKCSKGHEWQTKVESRVLSGSGCPYCSEKAHKKVVCIETGTVFESLSEASEKTFGNLKNVTNISNVCKGKREKAGGYHWKFSDE